LRFWVHLRTDPVLLDQLTHNDYLLGREYITQLEDTRRAR